MRKGLPWLRHEAPHDSSSAANARRRVVVASEASLHEMVQGLRHILGVQDEPQGCHDKEVLFVAEVQTILKQLDRVDFEGQAALTTL